MLEVGAHLAEAGAEVVERSGHGGEGGDGVQSQRHERQPQRAGDEHIEGEEAPHGGDDAFGHHATVEFERHQRVGVEQADDLAQALPVEQQHADDLHAAAGGTGGTADEAHHHQHDGHEGGPAEVVGAGKAGGGGQRDGLEAGVAQRRLPVGVGVGQQQIAGADENAGAEHEGVGAELRIQQVGAQAQMPPGGEVQGEIDPGDEHEHHGDGLDGHAVEVADAGVMGGEAADGHGGEGVSDGVEGVHAGGPVGQCAQDGEGYVDEPQGACRLADARGQLAVLHGAGGFGAVELHATDAQHGQDGHRQHDDAHAAEPLQLLAVPQNGVGQVIQPGHDGGAGGGQAGEGFEDGVGDAQLHAAGEVERNRTHQSQNRPEGDDHQKAVLDLEIGAGMAGEVPQQPTHRKRQQQGGGKGEQRPVAVDERHHDRWHQTETVDGDQDADDFEDHLQVHVTATSASVRFLRARTVRRPPPGLPCWRRTARCGLRLQSPDPYGRR